MCYRHTLLLIAILIFGPAVDAQIYKHGIFLDKTTVEDNELVRVLVSTREALVPVEVKDLAADRVVLELIVPGSAQHRARREPWQGLGWTRGSRLGPFPAGVYHVSIPKTALDERDRVVPKTHLTYRVPLLVRPEVATSEVLLVIDSNTWQAYNAYGGRSYYSSPFAVTVGRDRPGTPNHVFRRLRAMAEIVDNLGIPWDIADTDYVEDRPGLFAQYRLVVLMGQFEYMTREFRGELAGFFEAGGRILSLGNEMSLYHTRRDGTLKTTYKEPYRGPDPVELDGDPSNDHLASYEWARIGEPATRLFGLSTWLAGNSDGDVVWTAHRGNHWVWRDTGLEEGSQFSTVTDFLDGTLLRFEAGGPVPDQTEQTETPLDLLVLATAPTARARPWWLWEAGRTPSTACCQTGWGVIGIRQNAAGGVLAVAGSKRFSDGNVLEADAVVRQITTNFLRELAKAGPIDAYGGYQP